MTDSVIERENNSATLRPQGDIVADSAPQLRATLRQLLADGVRQVVLDLNDVHMVDSTGLGLLFSTHNSLQKLGGSFSIIRTSDEILRFFQAMRVQQHFSVSGQIGA